MSKKGTTKKSTSKKEKNSPKKEIKEQEVEEVKAVADKKPSRKQEKPLQSEMHQPEVSIGTIGQVDDGKSTLVQALTNKFPDEHSEELKRGISIRLGYADTDFRKCKACPEPDCYTVSLTCPKCNEETEFLRRVSFVDCPGHEILMATLLSGAFLMDGAILVIAANAECPQPQTREHLAAMEILGIKNIVIAQNKIELVSKEDAKKNYQQIRDFTKGTVAENAPIIPLSAMHRANLDLLIKAIEDRIPSPVQNPNEPLEMQVARSFDVNRPGTMPSNLRGGVLGGAIVTGTIKVNEPIEIVPGIPGKKGGYVAMTTNITSITVGEQGFADSASSGGLVAVGTELDPSLTKADKMAGSIITSVGHAPPIRSNLILVVKLMENVVGAEKLTKVQPLAQGETLMLNVGTAKTAGVISEIKGEIAKVKLSREVAARAGTTVAISRRMAGRFRLIGVGEIRDN